MRKKMKKKERKATPNDLHQLKKEERKERHLGTKLHWSNPTKTVKRVKKKKRNEHKTISYNL